MKLSGTKYASILVGPLGVQEGQYIKCTQGTFPKSLAPSLKILAEELEVGSRDCMWILERCSRCVEVEAVSTWLGLIGIHAENSSSCSGAVGSSHPGAPCLLIYGAVTVFPCVCGGEDMGRDGQGLSTPGAALSLVRSSEGDSQENQPSKHRIVREI